MFVGDHNVGVVVGSRGLYNLRNDETPSIDALAVWKQEFQFFGELGESRGRVSGGGNENFWVCFRRSRVFIVNVGADDSSVVVL